MTPDSTAHDAQTPKMSPTSIDALAELLWEHLDELGCDMRDLVPEHCPTPDEPNPEWRPGAYDEISEKTRDSLRGAVAALRSRLSPGGEATDDEIAGKIAFLESTEGTITTAEAASLLRATRRSVSATPDAPKKCGICGAEILDGLHQGPCDGSQIIPVSGDVPADPDEPNFAGWHDVLNGENDRGMYRVDGYSLDRLVRYAEARRALPVPMLTEEQREALTVAADDFAWNSDRPGHGRDGSRAKIIRALLASIPSNTEEKPHG
jgi:hypothetical protein